MIGLNTSTVDTSTVNAVGCFLVIQNTPGYIPETAPVAFDGYLEAIEGVKATAESIVDDILMTSEENDPQPTITYSDDRTSAFVHNPNKIYDLGISVEVQYFAGKTADQYNEEAEGY